VANLFNSLMEDFINLADSSVTTKGHWREKPVDLITFFSDKSFLGEKPYPGKQTELLEIVNEILWNKLSNGEKISREELRKVTELVVMFGKGSGKDFLASGILAYVAYLLECMNDPQKYFGFGQDEPIDLINVAINAYQANNVYFKKLKARLINCPWFKRVLQTPSAPNEFQITKNQIRFFNSITAHSAHSEADSFEGFNPLVVIFDEIGGFEYEKAQDAYSSLRSSASSRYNEKILLIFISFPRSENDFMMKKYKESQTDDPEVYGMIGKSWEINPKIKRESLEKDYLRDPEDSKMKYESLTGDTIIWTTEGACRIDEITNNKIIRTAHGSRNVEMFINSGKKYVYEIQTNEGYTIKGSINHPMKVLSNSRNFNEFEWKTIGKLKKYDRIFIDLNNDLFGKATISKNMALLIGRFVLYGEFNKNKVCAKWYFNKNDNQIDVYINAFKEEFGIEPAVYYKRKHIILQTDEKIVINKIEKLGINIENKPNIEIPSLIFKQSKEIILQFLTSILDVRNIELKTHETINIFTKSHNLAKQIQHLFLMVGIKSVIFSKFNLLKRRFAVNISKQEYEIFNSKINSSNFTYSGRFPFVTVKEIVYVGEEVCYDLWVEPENEFIANGMGVHNCIPPKYLDGLFQFPERIDAVVKVGKTAQCPNLIIQEKITTRTLKSGEERHFIGLEIHNLQLNPSFTYYLGGDGGVETDSYVISLFHAEPTLVTTIENGEVVEKFINKPVEDLLIEWKPSKKDRLPVDLMNVIEVLELIASQVHVKKALFDKFNSADVVQRLMALGIEAEDKNWSNQFQVQIYQNLKGLIYTNNIELLDHVLEDNSRLNANDELKHIKIINGNKIDHDKDKAKDFSDARAGAVWVCSTDEPTMTENFSMPVILGAKRK